MRTDAKGVPLVNQAYNEEAYNDCPVPELGEFESPDGLGQYDGETALHLAVALGDK
eukprot:gene32660-28998_t